MATKINRGYMQTYDKLMRLFPLRPIRTEDENDEAARVCDMLTDRINNLSQAESDYLEVLTDLVAKFETRWSDEVSQYHLRQLFEYLMKAHNLKQSDLIPEFGSASRVSEFLSGKRGLSLEQAKKLANRFKLRLDGLLMRQ